jgi:hypothetical protein
MIDVITYSVLVPPAAFIVTIVLYYSTWMAWEMFRNN